LNDSSGNHLANVSGTYSFWVDENILFFVPKYKILGGYFAPYIALNPASGSLVADITGTSLSTAAAVQVSAIPGSSQRTWVAFEAR